MSKFLSLSTQQWLKGLLIAVAVVVFKALADMLQGENVVDLVGISKVGIQAALAYILASLTQNSKNQLLTTEEGKVLGIFQR